MGRFQRTLAAGFAIPSSTESVSRKNIDDTAVQKDGLAQTGFLTGVRDDPVQRANRLEWSAASKPARRPIAALTATKEHEEMRILLRVDQQACCTKQILWGLVTQAQGEPKRLGWIRSIRASHVGLACSCGNTNNTLQVTRAHETSRSHLCGRHQTKVRFVTARSASMHRAVRGARGASSTADRRAGCSTSNGS